MSSTSIRAALLIAIVAGPIAVIHSQRTVTASWLDVPKPSAWNTPGATVPLAHRTSAPSEDRCLALARPAQTDLDERVRDEGWDLVDAYQGGWHMVVIRGAASYDGMCRPIAYQDFVFVRGAFAGTLAPRPMDSRSDGALSRVFLQNEHQLIAEYQRYDRSDPLCCPTKTTRVVFEIANGPVVQPVSASTSQVSSKPAGNHEARGLLDVYWKAIELAGKPTPTQDPSREAHLQFQSGGRVSGSDGCNRITGSYQLSGERVTFGQMAATQMACVNTEAIERPFQDALKNATRLTVSRDHLELFDAKGTRLAAFAADRARRARFED
jgi:heat shock protein HslJ